MLILSKLKQIMDFMVFIAYNLKLETYLLRDQFCQSPDEVPPSVQDLESLPSVMKEDSSDIPIETQLQDMIKAYSFTKLSASPQVSFHAPYLIQRKLDKEKSGQVGLGRRKSMDLAKSDTILPPENPKPDFTMLPQSDEDGEIIVSAIDANRAFLTTGSKDRADVDYLLDKSRRFLDPYVHQNIAILYSSVCKSMTEPCQPPELQLIEYYRDSDLTLGQYIEDACFNSSMSCSVKGCEKPILLHTRIYTHGNGKMLVTMEEQPCPLEGMEDVILMRSTCHVCGESTPIVPIAPETWKYSFGKYLELTFYQTALSCRADICPHAVTRDHTRFFHWKNLEIEIEHSEIVLFEVLVPPMLLDMKPEVFVKIRQADEDIIRLQITAYFDSVLDRIKHFSLDIVPATRLMQAKEMTAEMTKRCGSEKKFFLQLLQQTCVSAHQTDFIALNTVTKALLDKVASWDAEFNSFARNILQQESRDIRRMTAVQLKKMFTDRDAPEVKPIVALPSELARLELEAEQDATESVDSFLPVLGGSPMLSEVHLHGSPLDIPSYSRNRRHSVMLLRDTMHLENHIHVPRFGTSPTLETPVATISRLEASVLEIQETAPDESLKHPDTPTVTASESQLDIAGEGTQIIR